MMKQTTATLQASTATLAPSVLLSSRSDYLDTDRTKTTLKHPRPLTASVKIAGFTKEFKHSGLGYSKQRLGAVIVDNNAVS